MTLPAAPEAGTRVDVYSQSGFGPWLEAETLRFSDRIVAFLTIGDGDNNFEVRYTPANSTGYYVASSGILDASVPRSLPVSSSP
jgi:hypothetical protein